MSRPLLIITLSLMAGTALAHIYFYEWNHGSDAAGSIVFLWGGLCVLTLLTALLLFLARRPGLHNFSSHALIAITILFFTIAGTLRYARHTAHRWQTWTEMKARVGRPINRGNPDEFNYERWLWVQQKYIGPDGYTVLDEPQPLDTLRHRALRFRTRLIQRYADAGLEGDTLALIAAMTLGDRSQVSRQTRSLYADAGASHLLALSGLHLGIIMGLFSWLFGGRRLRWSRWRIPAIIILLLLVWTYAFVAGLPTSLVRASLMTSIFLLAMAMSRDSSALNNLMLTVAAMLLLRPTYLMDVGAQLSVTAVLGIALCYGPVIRWFCQRYEHTYACLRRLHLWPAIQLLLVSFSAQVLTTPLVAHYFHYIAPWGTLFSLIYIPLTTLVIYGSLLLQLLPYPLLAHAVSLLIGTQSWVMQLERQLPLSHIPDFWSAKAQPGLVIYNNPRQPALHLIASPSESWVLLSDSVQGTAEESLRYIASSFWAKRLTAPPIMLHGQHTLQAAGFRVAMIDNDLRWPVNHPSTPPSPTAPIPIDVLLIARGFRGHLPTAAGNSHGS